MADGRLYPTGAGQKSRVASGIVVDFGYSKVQRTRVPAASITTAGFALLPPIQGVKWRFLDLTLIAIGATVGGATLIVLLGTRAGAAVTLASAAVAGLTQSTVVRFGPAALVGLADGASFPALDANTGVFLARTGAAITGATNVDAILTFVADLP